jgi:hypothetical protein
MSESMNDVFDLEVAARYVRLRPKTLLNKKSSGMGPKCRKIGRNLYYNKADLDAWLGQIEQVYSPSIVG